MSRKVASAGKGLCTSAAGKSLGNAFVFGLDGGVIIVQLRFFLQVLLSRIEIARVDLGLTVGLLLHRVIRHGPMVVKLRLVMVTQLGLRLAQTIGLTVQLHILV